MLTKKYRLIWNPETLIIIGNWDTDYGDSITHPGVGRSYFESDNLTEIEQKILEFRLIYDISKD